MCNTCFQDDCLCNDPCSNNGCPINLEASCVFYKLEDTTPSGLTCIGLPNGTNLKIILEAFDQKLCSISGFSYSPYDLGCLRDSYVITNVQQFSEAVATEICATKTNLNNVNTSLTASITNINSTLAGILVPSLTDNCFLGITPTDTLSQILQKILDTLCSILNINFTDQSPVLNAINSNSIQFTTSGVKNHNIIASLRVSTDAGNTVQVRTNGLFVPSIASGYQVLSYDVPTRVITLSGGGGTITLPADSDAQTLSFNTLTKILTISNGNTVDLSSLATALSETFLTATDSATIDFTTSGTSNHTLTGSVKLSANAGNVITAQPDGLYAPASVFSFSDTDIANLLTDIDASPALKSQLFALVYDEMCFSFTIENTDVSSHTYDYIDCSGGSNIGVSIGAGSTVSVIGKSVSASSTTVKIYNLGLN